MPIAKYARFVRPALRFAVAAGVVIAAFLVNQILVYQFGLRMPLFIVIFPAVMVDALLFGLWPGVMASVLATALTDYWIFTPIGEFRIEHFADCVALAFFFLMGVFISVLAERYRRNQQKLAAASQALALRETREQLEESTAYQQIALEAAGLGAWDYRLDTGEVVWDERCRNEFGFSAGDALDYTAAIANIVPEDRTATDEAVKRAIRGENDGAYHREFRVAWPDGSFHWIASHGRVYFSGEGADRRAVRFIGVNADVTEQKLAHEVQRESAERYRLLAETMLQGVVHQAADGKIIAMNPAAERILGWTMADYLGNTSVDVDTETIREDGSPFPGHEHPAMVSLRTGKPTDGVVMGVQTKRSGGPLWIEIAAVPLFRPGQTAPYQVYTVFEDITERRQAQSAIETILQRFYVILSNLNSAILLVTGEGKVEFANKAFCDRFGLEDSPVRLAGLTASTMLEKIKPAYREPDEAIDRIVEVVKQEKLVMGEEVPMRDGGTCLRDYVPLTVDGKSYGRLWVHADITERKRMETRLRRFYETGLFAILYWKIDGGVVDVNDRLLEMTGYTREDVRAGLVNWAAITPPEYHAADEEARRQIRETGVHQPYEKEYVRKDGSRVWGQFWAAAYEDDRNEGISFILDISERKRAEEDLRRAKREWERTFDSVPDLIAVLDNQHRIVRVNQAMARRLGATPQGCVGMPCYACVHGATSPIGICPHTLTLRDHREHAAEVHEDRLGGDFLVTTTPMFNEHGEMDGTVHVARNITESKQAEEALKASESRYRNLFNAMNEGFCVVEMLFDAEGRAADYRFLEVNEAFEAQTGLHDAVGRRMKELVPDHEEHWFEIYGRIALTGEPAHFMDVAAALNRYYDVHAYRVGEPEQRRVAIVFNDISEYKRAEEALRASEERLRLALEAGRMGTWDLDVLSGNFIWNDEMFPMMGYQPGSVTPNYEGWTRRVLSEDLPGAEERFRQSLESGTDLSSEYRMLGLNDEVRWVEARGRSERDENGRAVRSFGVVMDITERRRAEDALREGETQLRLALNANRAGMWSVDLPSGVRTLSPELEQLYGFEPGEFDGTTEGSTSPVIPEDRESVAAAMESAMHSGGLEVDFRYTRAGSDEVRWMQARGRVIHDLEGRPIRMIGVNTDITERKRAEEALRASEEKHRLLAESISDPFFALDKDLRITFWSRRTEEFNGIPAEVALGKTRLELFGESESQRKSDAMCRQCMETQKPVRYEVQWTFGDNPRIFDVQLFPYAGGVATIGRDVTESRRAEEALRTSEMRFRLALSNAPVSISMQDRNFVFRWAYNQRTMNPDEIVGKTDYDLFLPEEIPAILEVKRRVLETGKPENVQQWITSRGKRFFLDLYIEPTWDGSGEIDGIGVAGVDLTDLKIAEESLKKSERQFRTLANAIPQLSWMADADGAIFWYNDRWYEYTGATWKEMEGWGWQSVHDPEVLPQVLERWRNSIAKGSPFEMVFPLRGADGVFRPFLTRVMPLKDADGKVMRWFGTNTDISEQKQTEAELRKNQERLNLALEVAQLGEWERDLKGGTASRSLRHAQIFGYDSVDSEWNFNVFLNHVLPDYRAEAAEQLKSQHSGEVVDFETKIRRTDGEERWIWVRSYIREGENGKPDRAYGVVQDITARKQVEEQLQKLNRTLKALSNCNQALMHSADEAEILDEVCRIVTGDCGYAMVWIGFAENDENKSVRPVAWSGFEEGYLQTLGVTWDLKPSGLGPTGTAIRTGQPSMCRSMQTDPAFAPWREEALKRGYASSLVIPLKDGEQAMGAITIFSAIPEAF